MKLQRHNLAMQWILRRRTNEVKGKANPLYNEFKKYQSALSDGFEGTMNEYMMGQQVKDGGRIEMKPGGIVEPGVVHYGKKEFIDSLGRTYTKPTGPVIPKGKLTLLNQYSQHLFGKNYEDIIPGSKEHYTVHNKVLKGKFLKKSLSGRDPLLEANQLKIKKQFPTADFTQGKYGFKKSDPNYSRARDFAGRGYKIDVRSRLPIATQREIIAKFELPEGVKEWDFKKFKYGIPEAGGKNAAFYQRIQNYINDPKQFKVLGDFHTPEGWMLTQMNRAFEHGSDKYEPVYDKVNNKKKIVGFTDNTEYGKGKTYFTTKRYADKYNGTLLSKHVDYANTKKFINIANKAKLSPNKVIKDLLVKGGIVDNRVTLNTLLNYMVNEKGVQSTHRALVLHHKGGIPGRATGDYQILNRLVNKKITGVEQAMRAGQITPDNINKLKNLGASITIDGKTYGSGPKTAIGGFREAEKLVQSKLEGYGKKDFAKLKTYIEKIGCPGLAAGGRVGFGTGGDTDCFKKGQLAIRNNDIKTKGQAKNMLKLAETGARSSALRSWLGIYGLAGEAIIEAGIGAYKVLGQGVPAKIAWSESYWSYLDPRKYTGELSNLRRKDLEKGNPRIAKYYDALDVLEKRDYHSKWVNQMNPNDPTHESHVNKLNQYDEIIRNFYGGPSGITKMMERVEPEIANAEAEQAGKWAGETEEEYGWMFSEQQKQREADRKQKLAMKEYMLARGIKTMPYTKDGKPVYKKDFDMMPTRPDLSSPEAMADFFIDDAWARGAIKEHAPRLYGKASERRYIPMVKQAIFSDMRKDPEYNKMVISESMRLDPSMLGTQERFNTGGRVSFKFGGRGIDEGRRAFLKLLAALGIGTAGAKSGISLFGKAVGKKTAVTAGADIVTNTQGMPSWFPALVNKIIREGDDVTKKLGTVEREVVHTKKLDSKDVYGDEVTVYRNLDTGDIRVEVDSVSNMGQAPIQLDYKAPSVIDSGKSVGKKTKPEFSAVESEPRVANMDGDIEFDGENVVGNVEDLMSDTTNLKNYAKGEKPTMQDIVTRKKKTDIVEEIHERPGEHINNKYGDGPDLDYDAYLPDIDDID